MNKPTEWYFINRFNELLYGKEIEEDEIMTVEGAADYLKTTETTVYALLKKGKIRKWKFQQWISPVKTNRAC